MKIYSFYHAETGQLHPATFRTDAADPAQLANAVMLNTPAGHLSIEGAHDSLCQRVDLSTGAVVNYQPSAPSADHEWDEVSRRWRIRTEISEAKRVRARLIFEIERLEITSMRAVRESALGDAGAVARLRETDVMIRALREKLTQV